MSVVTVSSIEYSRFFDFKPSKISKMDDYSDFESQNPENRFPTALELQEIKRMLLTGERSQILQSIEKIKIFLNCEDSLSEILRSDISEFLCDAVIPFDSVIVCTLYHCVEVMAAHVEFYIHEHSCFAIESLMRTLHLIVKDSNNSTGVSQCLSLLNTIMQGYNTHNMNPETKTLENLLDMLPSLLTNLSPTLNNKYQVGVLILNLIQIDLVKWSQEASEMILKNLSSWFSVINPILELEHPMGEKLILLSSKICYSVLRSFVSSKSSVELDVNLKNEIIHNVIAFLITTGTPYFDSLPLSGAEDESSHLENFLQAILCIFCETSTFEKVQLTHGLSEVGFLQLATRIITYSHDQKLRRLCILVLFRVVLHLSEEVFYFPEVWPNGRDDFRREVQDGISQLPTDATLWLDVLVSTETLPPCKLALLLYLYFYSMTARSQDILQSMYPAVAAFIRSTKGVESSLLLLKVVWFVFVMCQLSTGKMSCTVGDNEATNAMVSLLEARGDLSLVYTHHPALLYWAFSSEVSSNIQTRTVHLWLRNKTPECRELDDLMKKSSDVRFAILEILDSGHGQVLESAFSSLKSLLVDSNDKELASSIWFLLPQVLAKFTADSTSVTNVDYVIELCSLRPPHGTDITRIIRVASLLPEVLLKSDLISVVPSLSLVLQLLQTGLEMEDHRVLYVFLRREEFILKILEGLHANVFDVSFLSIQILILFWKEGNQIKNIERREKIEISEETIFKLLETDCQRVLKASLVFLEEIFLTHFHSPIFCIRDVNGSFLEILFFEILNACFKCAPNASNHCWKCAKLILTLQGEESVQEELVNNPLLQEVMLYHIPRLKDSKEFKDLLFVWRDQYDARLKDSCLERRIFGEFYSEIIIRAERMLKDDTSVSL